MASDEKKAVTFVLNDTGSGLSVTKRITFDAASYSADLDVRITRGDQLVPQAKLKVGPSIGDQGIRKHTFYSVAPEAIASVGGR